MTDARTMEAGCADAAQPAGDACGRCCSPGSVWLVWLRAWRYIGIMRRDAVGRCLGLGGEAIGYEDVRFLYSLEDSVLQAHQTYSSSPDYDGHMTFVLRGAQGLYEDHVRRARRWAVR